MNPSASVPKYPHFINGERCEPATGNYQFVLNPATGEPMAEVAMGDDTDVERAVEAATRAFADPAWRKMPVAERSRILYAMGNAIMAHGSELAQLEIESSGGTITRMMGMDILAMADLFYVLAEEVKNYPFVESLPPRPLPEQIHTQVLREPVGVCGLITAWNFPMLLFSWKVAPAIAAGNTVVIKPSELTPCSTLRLAEIMSKILPPGVLNVVNGSGAYVGEALTRHPKVDKISFTGSTNVGREIQRNAADTLKRVSLELGGKGPGIVLPDANIDNVAYGALFGVLLNAGQACESGTRLLVHESIYEEVTERLAEVAKQIVVGDPKDPQTSMGPMCTEAHFTKVMDYIDSAKEEGARIVCGGKRATVPGCEGGFFVEPTVIADTHNHMRHVSEEIFGPVISLVKFSTLEEAIELANDSIYGLSAGIWSEDVYQAQEIARELRAGSIWINDWHMIRTDAPFGGFKQSGYGREMGRYSLEAYTEIKAVSTAFERIPAKKPMYHLVHKQFA